MGAKRLNRKGVSAHGGSILFGALAAVCSLLHCSSAWAATTAEVLLQTNTLAGTHEVTYCELGLRIKSMRGDYVIVMKPLPLSAFLARIWLGSAPTISDYPHTYHAWLRGQTAASIRRHGSCQRFPYARVPLEERAVPS